MYKKRLILALGLLIANPMITFGGDKPSKRMNPYLERGLYLAGAVVLGAAAFYLSKGLIKYWNTNWAIANKHFQEADQLLNLQCQKVAQAHPTLKIQDASGAYSSKFKETAKSFLPPDDPYFTTISKGAAAKAGYEVIPGWLLVIGLAGGAYASLHNFFTVKK